MSANGTATSSATPSATPTPSPSQSPSLTQPSSVVPPTSEQPSSSAAILPSSQAASSNAAPASSSPVQSVVTAASKPASTQIVTSVITPSVTSPGETATPSVIVITSVVSASDSSKSSSKAAAGSSASATSTADPSLQNPNAASRKGTGGLSTGGKTAIAVVVPVVVVALLLLAGIILWRKRKQRKNAEEARRKEVEEYGFNPNNDPTLPATGMQSEMAEDQSGYRGWGNTTTSSNRKASTTLNSGMTYSDSNSNPGGYQSPGSPTQAHSDVHSTEPLMHAHGDSEEIGALGVAPSASQNQNGVRRGPSNASSSYSAANRSDHSGDYPLPMNHQQEYYDNNYHPSNPYGNDTYGATQQPIIRDVSARRNTRIENPSVFPQQGNSGIAQNF